MMNIMCCPVCRAICCIFNEKDTCCKHIPSNKPGYNCPDFLREKETEDDIQIVFVEYYGSNPLKHLGGERYAGGNQFQNGIPHHRNGKADDACSAESYQGVLPSFQKHKRAHAERKTEPVKTQSAGSHLIQRGDHEG